jgi:pimeloyl-ACP methyl ester carboxylesterase
MPRALVVLVFLTFGLVACRTNAEPALHRDVLVFVPAYEGSELFDPTLGDDPHDPLCVWGNFNVMLSSTRYFALRLPNPLEPRPLLRVGPLDVYGAMVKRLTQPDDATPAFHPYTLGADFFIFTYDWRQEIGAHSAPELGRALETYARLHAQATGVPAASTRFILLTHSMGGLVARTLLHQQPQLAPRIECLYLVGTPNGGSVKAVRTVIVGPDTIDDYAHGFPGILANLIPTNVDSSVTKLVGDARPSLYELLPTGDPHWQATSGDGAVHTIATGAVFDAATWKAYWPSAAIERRLFLDGWLKARKEEGRKSIDAKEWEYCQDPAYPRLTAMVDSVRAWRQSLGPVSETERLLTSAGEPTRLRVICGTGLPTPTGVVSRGEHDAAIASYIYEPANSGDGTVEMARVIDDLPAGSANIARLPGVAHGRLMIDPRFLSLLTRDLAGAPTVPKR